ncbi:MAB_1171c family putative transporter [Streptomyces sp. INA 01156]
MRNSDYYLPAIALGIAFVVKLPALRRGWRDPLVRSAHFLLFTAGVCFFFAAPPTIVTVNDLTGIPNFSGPLVYSIMCAFSCACLVLIVNWRGGPPETIRRHSRRWIAGYTAVIVALPVFFALGDAPVERLRDLDTYYATTPFLREMIVTYLVAHITSAAVTTALCLSWARQVQRWLRAGLVVLVIGFVLNLVFGIAKLSAVIGRWSGRDWDALSTTVAPPIVAAGGLIVTFGFLLPLLGPQISGLVRCWVNYARLGALWRLLRTPGDGVCFRASRGGPIPTCAWPCGRPPSTTNCSISSRTSTTSSGNAPTTERSAAGGRRGCRGGGRHGGRRGGRALQRSAAGVRRGQCRRSPGADLDPQLRT